MRFALAVFASLLLCLLASAQTLPSRKMDELNWLEFREIVPAKTKTVLLTTGTLEPHGVIPNGADNLAPVRIAEALAPEVNALGFQLRERTQTLGMRAAVSLREPLRLEVGAGAVWRPEDRDLGDGTRVEHRDREVLANFALVRQPQAGSTWRIGYAHDDRSAGVLAPSLTAVNRRLLMEYGHRFRRGFDVMVGVRWDLDQGWAAPFDGGHLRFGATW